MNKQDKAPDIGAALSLATDHIIDLERKLTAALDMITTYKALTESMGTTIVAQKVLIRESELEDEWGEYEMYELFEMYCENDRVARDKAEIKEYFVSQWGDWDNLLKEYREINE